MMTFCGGTELSLLKPHRHYCAVTQKLGIMLREMLDLLSHYLRDFSLGIVQYS